jgi:inosine/xanthosine triphosphatase
MKILVGSKNPIKLAAVFEALKGHSKLIREGCEIEGVEVDSEVGHQPRSLPKTVLGAHIRAWKAWESSKDCQIAVGIESGLFEIENDEHVPYDLNVCACVILTPNPSLGLSGAWMVPQEIMKHVHIGHGLNTATKEAGYTDDESLKQGEGLISILTEGRIARQGYVQQAVEMALVNAWKQIGRGP